MTRRAWYCVRAQNKREHIAAIQVQTLLGAEVFCPRICLTRQMVNGRNKKFTEALFPGYFFIQTVLEETINSLTSMRGVVDWVRMGDYVPPVPHQWIECLRRELKTGHQVQTSTLPPLQEGDLVRIFEGLFRGMEGKVVALESGGNRVALLLNLLGREARVVVPRQSCGNATTDTAGSYRIPASLKSNPAAAVQGV